MVKASNLQIKNSLFSKIRWRYEGKIKEGKGVGGIYPKQGFIFPPLSTTAKYDS